jgi:hypothetical protein
MNPPCENHLCLLGVEEQASMTGRFQSLRAYDEADPQLDELEIDSETQSDRPYRGSLLLTPAQVYCNGKSETVSLSMAARYIYSNLCRGSDSLLQKLVPYRYVPGRNHGKRQGKHRLWDMRLVAGGKEGIVEALQQRSWEYERSRLDTLLTQWDLESRACVYFIDDPDTPEPTRHIIFSDKQALERIQFRSFLHDCRTLEQPPDALRQAIDAEIMLFQRFLDAAYVEASRAHLEKVVRIPRAYKMAL